MKKHIFLFYFTIALSFFSHLQSQTTLAGQIDNLNKDTITCELLVDGITRNLKPIKYLSEIKVRIGFTNKHVLFIINKRW